MLAGLCVLAPTAAARPAPPDLCLLARRLRVGGGGLGVVPTCKAQPARLVVRRPLGCIWQCDGGALRTHEGRRGGPPGPPGGRRQAPRGRRPTRAAALRTALRRPIDKRRRRAMRDDGGHECIGT